MSAKASLPWTSLKRAAIHIDAPVATLRKRFERDARPDPDGVLEAAYPGLRARKILGRWKVQLSSGWGGPANDR